jgi:hypothetical protein
MKNIVFFLVLMLGFGRVTAQVTETTEGGDIQQTLNTLFQNVNLSQAPTGIFMNKAIYFTNIHKYDGTIISDSTDVNINTFGWLYSMLGMAKVGTNTFPDAETLYGKDSYTQGSAVPLTMLCQRYNHFKDNIFSKNLISTRNYQLFDVVGRTESPYAEDTLFVVTPVINKFKSGTLSFVLPSNRILQNVGSFQSISIDFGTGSGFQAVTIGQTINATLPSGMNRAILRVQFSNGRTLKCRFEIEVPQTAAILPTTASGGIDDIYKADNSLTETITATRPQDGTKLIIAEVTTFFACSDNKLRKPLFILDGFNSDTEGDGITTEGFLRFFNDYKTTPNSLNSDRAITRDLRKDGYDLIFVNWISEGGRDDIRRNAFLLQQIIATMNTRKAINKSIEKNVIIGISMGGVIAKYALLDLERKNPNMLNGGHDVKTFISYDSPLQGANIPLGFQYMLKDLGDGILGGLLGRNVGQLKGGLVSLKSSAAKQLITYQAFDSNPKFPSNFTSFYNELNGMGKLQKCEFRTISNGSLVGTQNFSAGKSLLKLTAPIPPLVLLTGAYLKFDVNTLPPTSQNYEIIYKRTIVVVILGVPLPILPALSIDIRDFRALDGAPGGTTTVGIPDLPVFVGRYDDGNKEVLRPTFIPVVSALDLRSPERDNPLFNVSNEQALMTNQIVNTTGMVGSRNSSQFDAAEFLGNPVNRVTNQVHAGLSYRTTGYLLYNLITRDPLQTARTVNLTTRTYNFGSNALMFPLTPPSQGSFQAKSVNNIIDYTLNIENTGKLWVNRAGKVGFTDDANSPNNATDVDYSLIIRQAEGCKAELDRFSGIVNVKNNGTVLVADGSINNTANIRIRSGGELRIQNLGNLTLERSATRIDVESGGKLFLESGSITNLTGLGSKIIVKQGGQLVINGGANINFTGISSSILIESGGELVFNGGFKYSGVGFLQFDQGHILTLNSDFGLRGSGKTNTMIVLTDAPPGTVNKLVIKNRSIVINSARITYGVNCQIDITNDDSQQNIFNNVTFQGVGSGTALNFINAAQNVVQNSDFNNLSQGVAVFNSTTTLSYAHIKTCNFNLVSNGIVATAPTPTTLPWNWVLINSCTFNYKVGSNVLNDGIACKFVNLMSQVDFDKCTLSGSRVGTNFGNTIGIELQNTTISMNESKIIDFKTGINADKDVNNNIGLTNTEISTCETGVNLIGVVGARFPNEPFGTLKLSCSKLINNTTGVKGTDIKLLIDVRNNFQNPTNGLLFDICYPRFNQANMANIQVSNNFWLGGFGNMKFKLLVGSCTTGTRRKLEQCMGGELLTAPTSCTVPIANCCNKSTIVCDGTGLTPTTGAGIVCLMSNNSNNQASANTKTADETDTQLINPISTGHKTGLFVYPNPAKETVNLNLDNGNYQIRVSNAIGQVIFEQNTEGVLSVNVSTWTNGIYLFEVTDKLTNEQQRKKIVVQH